MYADDMRLLKPGCGLPVFSKHRSPQSPAVSLICVDIQPKMRYPKWKVDTRLPLHLPPLPSSVQSLHVWWAISTSSRLNREIVVHTLDHNTPQMFLVMGLIPNCAGLLGSETLPVGVTGLSIGVPSFVLTLRFSACIGLGSSLIAHPMRWNGFATNSPARGLKRASSASAGRCGSLLARSV